MTAHVDSGARCLVLHADGDGQCVRCTCGVWVRPREWQAHVDASEKEDARLKRVEQHREAEEAVLDAADRWSRRDGDYMHINLKLALACAKLRALKEES